MGFKSLVSNNFKLNLNWNQSKINLNQLVGGFFESGIFEN
jgi:hypothetical protein